MRSESMGKMHWVSPNLTLVAGNLVLIRSGATGKLVDS